MPNPKKPEAAQLPEGAKVDKETGALHFPSEPVGEQITTASVSEYGKPKVSETKEPNS